MSDLSFQKYAESHQLLATCNTNQTLIGSKGSCQEKNKVKAIQEYQNVFLTCLSWLTFTLCYCGNFEYGHLIGSDGRQKPKCVQKIAQTIKRPNKYFNWAQVYHVFYIPMIRIQRKRWSFLAVQDSSIGDLVTHSLTHLLTF